jgi:hypothetical protein
MYIELHTQRDTMGIKTEQRKFAHVAGRNWKATALEELHGAQTPEKKENRDASKERWGADEGGHRRGI